MKGNMSKIPDLLKAEEARQALGRMVCDTRVPPKAFCSEDKTFMTFMNHLNPNLSSSFKFASLERNCLRVYKEEKVIVKEVFSKLGGRISLSADVTIDDYICLAAHFIDSDWKLRKWVIKFRLVYGTNQEYPTEAIMNSLKEWNIGSKVFSLLGGKDLVDLAKEEMQGMNDLPLNGQLFHVLSSCEFISRMVQVGYKEIDNIISKVQTLSWSKSMPLWYLTTYKLKNALELEDMGEFSSTSPSVFCEIPTKEEWGKVRSMCRIADKIYESVEDLFVVKKPAASLFLPHFLEIWSYLTQELASSDEFVKVVSQKMLKIFDEYWKEMYLVLSIAASMDPRYKMKFIELSFPKVEGSEGDSKAALVLETVRKLYDCYAVQHHQQECSLNDVPSDSEDEEYDDDEDEEDEEKNSENRSKRQCRKLLDKLDILRKYRWSFQSTKQGECVDEMKCMQSTKNQPLKSELDQYLEEPVLPWDDDFCVLRWWKDNCSKYPRVSRMARDVLAIPLTLATSFDAYNIEPRVADRTAITSNPDMTNALMCTRSWKLCQRKHH